MGNAAAWKQLVRLIEHNTKGYRKKKIIITGCATIALAMLAGCGVVDTVKNYDWTGWWNVHQEPLTELAKDAVSDTTFVEEALENERTEK